MIHFKNTILLMYVSLCCFVAGFSVSPCHVDDDGCILLSAKGLVSQIFATLDPMYHDKIEGKLSVLHFLFLNSTVTGFKDCSLTSLKIPLKELLQKKQASLKADISCERMSLIDDYEIDGRLIILPVIGKDFVKYIHLMLSTMANKNWKEVASLVVKPLFIAYLKQIVSTANKFLKTVPAESLFLK